MNPSSAHNLHVPISAETHRRLKRESSRSKRPATVLAREAIEIWLEEQARRALHQEIADYAEGEAGSHADLDAELERAAVDHLRRTQSH